MARITVRPVSGSSDTIAALLAAAKSEGFGMVHRLVENWDDGSNRFDRPGEAFLGVYVDDELAGVGGLNIDPYSNEPGVGRIRHVYIAPEARHGGLGQALVHELVVKARSSFSRVRLRAVTDAGSRFYEALGFGPTREPNATHTLDL